MSEMNQVAMVPATAEEGYPVEVIDPRVYDEREELRKDKIVDSIHKVAETVKTEAAIAKKEVDTGAHVTKAHTDVESEYIKSLLKEKERKGITPEECAAIDDRIEEALKRMNEQDNEARRQAEESPYRRPIPWGKVIKWVAIAGGIAFGGWKLKGAFAT